MLIPHKNRDAVAHLVARVFITRSDGNSVSIGKCPWRPPLECELVNETRVDILYKPTKIKTLYICTD